jgi:hypothetical protein
MAILSPHPMARPKGRNGKPKRLYLNPKITKPADKLAFGRNLSLSQLVENLLEEELKKAGVALPHLKEAA